MKRILFNKTMQKLLRSYPLHGFTRFLFSKKPGKQHDTARRAGFLHLNVFSKSTGN